MKMTLLSIARLSSMIASLAGALGCSAPSGVGLPCAASENCPGALACVDGACALAGDVAGDRGAVPAPAIAKPRVEVPSLLHGIVGVGPDDEETDPGEGDGEDVNPPVDDDEGAPTDPTEPVPTAPEWAVTAYAAPLLGKPRVIAGGADVETFFVRGTATSCAGLARARADGTVTSVSSPVVAGCLAELDAARTGDGVVHVVARDKWPESSSVVFVDVGTQGVIADLSFGPVLSEEHRGVRARIALTPGGSPDWMWSVRQAYGPDLIEQLHVTSDAPDVVAEVDGLVDDLDYVVDAQGNGALFVTDLTNNWLLLRTQGQNIGVEPDNVAGAIEAVSCGGALHVVYRRLDEVRIGRVTGTTVQPPVILESGVGGDRVRGDVALACDAGTVWAAWTVADSGVVRVASPSGAGFAVEDVAAAAGAVSLAVVAGVPHLAFGALDGTLRTAMRP